jgi:hypothetical protein
MEEARRREARTPATAMDTVRSDCYGPEGCVAAGSLEMLVAAPAAIFRGEQSGPFFLSKRANFG